MADGNGRPPRLLERALAPEIREALADTRVVVINGARQAGKSTLAQQVTGQHDSMRMLTLDDAAVLEAARADPTTFVQHDGLLLIDEIQRAPELLLAIKAVVDRNPQPGQFLLTGSAQILSLPKLADSLAGRMEILELWPLSQGELASSPGHFIDLLFGEQWPPKTRSTLSKRDYLQRAVTGGYPEVHARTEKRRARWFESYVTSLIQRDISELAHIERLDDLPRLLRLLAGRTGNLLNVEGLASDSRIPASSLRRYLTLLEAIFLIKRVPAWSNNRTTRAVKASKLYLVDSGLAAHLLSASVEALLQPTGAAGPLVETFAVMEMARQLGWAQQQATLHHFRTQDGSEVDAVLETAAGKIVGVEVKSTATVQNDDFRGLRLLSTKAAKSFVRGVVLYSGSEILSFGEDLWALPLSLLWEAKGARSKS